MIEYFFDDNINSKKFYDYYNSFFKLKNKNIYSHEKKNFNFFKYRADINDDFINILKKHNVYYFILYRKNIINQSLSRYFGHCQFIKSYKVERVDIDIEKLKKQISLTEFFINKKKYISSELKKRNIEYSNIYYEDFCENKNLFLKDILQNILYNIDYNIDVIINNAINKDINLKKVHSEDISTYVNNYLDVLNICNK